MLESQAAFSPAGRRSPAVATEGTAHQKCSIELTIGTALEQCQVTPSTQIWSKEEAMAILSMLIQERNKEMVEVRGLLRACTTMWEDATQRAADSQLLLKERLKLSQQGGDCRLEIAAHKKDIREASADAL